MENQAKPLPPTGEYQAKDAAGQSSKLNDADTIDQPLGATGEYQAGAGQRPSTINEKSTIDSQPGAADSFPGMEDLGKRIGPYRLIKELGEGGMGTVFLAEQEYPVRRQVALKIIRVDKDSSSVVARFEAERQALALMNHPNIAKVLDAGTIGEARPDLDDPASATAKSEIRSQGDLSTNAGRPDMRASSAGLPKGRPFFVMEVVSGDRITNYCDDNHLTLRDRLELFVPVCQAIQHAHQKGVIHRDIKPSNVLVTLTDNKPVPKVIDFGLAKAIDQPITDQPAQTVYGAVVGTLEYMSPEQADPETRDLDTRSDVYSLGVLLYELLTGTTPLDRSTLRGLRLAQIQQRIIDEDAQKPSTRLSSSTNLANIAAERKTQPAKLVKLIRGELDWIVLKALEKDRVRRYDSASALAHDVQRYLADEPVEACPPSVGYRLGKFARRNRVLLGTGSAILASLVVAVVVLILSNIQVTKALATETIARKRADSEYRRMYKLNTYTDLFTEQLLRRGVSAPSDHEQSILRDMVQLYQQMADPLDDGEGSKWEAAVNQLRAANVLAMLKDSQGAEDRYRSAIKVFEVLAVDFPDRSGARIDLARCYFNLGLLLSQENKPEAQKKAIAAYARAVEIHESLVDQFPDEPQHRRDLADDYNNVGVFLYTRKAFNEAEKLYRKAITLSEKLRAEEPNEQENVINLAANYGNLGNTVRDQGKLKESLAWYEQAIPLLDPLKTKSARAAYFLRNRYWDRANALGQLGMLAEASQSWENAIKLASGPDRTALIQFLKVTNLETKLKIEVAKTPASAFGSMYFEAAREFARAALLARQDDRDESLDAQYTPRALVLLRQAQQADYFRDPKRLQSFLADRDFNVFRRQKDFQTFVAGISSAPPATGKK